MGVYICTECDILWSDTTVTKAVVRDKSTSRKRCPDCMIGAKSTSPKKKKFKK